MKDGIKMKKSKVPEIRKVHILKRLNVLAKGIAEATESEPKEMDYLCAGLWVNELKELWLVYESLENRFKEQDEER